MNLEELCEKIIKKKVVRDSKRNIIKRTSDKENYKVEGNKEVKMLSKETIARTRGAKRAAIKRKATTSISNIKREKSDKLR